MSNRSKKNIYILEVLLYLQLLFPFSRYMKTYLWFLLFCIDLPIFRAIQSSFLLAWSAGRILLASYLRNVPAISRCYQMYAKDKAEILGLPGKSPFKQHLSKRFYTVNKQTKKTHGRSFPVNQNTWNKLLYHQTSLLMAT